jgi:hypothetical protein
MVKKIDTTDRANVGDSLGVGKIVSLIQSVCVATVLVRRCRKSERIATSISAAFRLGFSPLRELPIVCYKVVVMVMMT